MIKRILSISLLINLANADFIRDDSTNIVIDTSTNLMWQDDGDANSKKLNWDDAIRYCENTVNLGGFYDWHLPNFNELYSLANRNKINPSISEEFKVVSSRSYWTSTSDASDASSKAWGVYFKYGYDYKGNKSNKSYVRCVRLVGD